jgi:hypothetical protein
MRRFISRLLGVLVATTSWSMALGLTEISYPVYLPYNQSDEKIDIRGLAFASRGASPEFLGSALSAPYLVPNDDSANLPKDINLISVCGIKVSTGLAEPRTPGEAEAVALEIDLRKLNRPEFIPFDLKEVVSAVGKAIKANLTKRGYRIQSLIVHATAEQAAFKSELEVSLAPKKAEGGAGR